MSRYSAGVQGMDRIRKIGLSLIAAVVVALFVACPFKSNHASVVGLPSALVGLWQGFMDFDGRQVRVEIKISQNPEGELSGLVDLRDFATLDLPVKVEIVGDNMKVTTRSGSLFEGILQPDLQSIQGALFAGSTDSWHDLVLEKDNEVFRAFAVPRLTDTGTAQQDYVYRRPLAVEDGWSVSSLSAENIDEAKIGRLVESVFREEQGRPEAILIARNGKLVLEEYFYGFSRDRIHAIQSVTKSVMSLLFGIAWDRGYIGDLDQPVYDFFPEYRGKKWIDQQYPITLAHLLTMSAAIEWNDESFESSRAMYQSGDWFGYVLDRDRVGEPGEVASYANGLAFLLGGVFRNATGEYVDEFAEKTLFADLGISNYRWKAIADGNRNTGGGLSIAAYDLAKMGQLVLSRGEWNGKQVISESWITESAQRHYPYAEESFGGSSYTKGYGYLWWHQRYNMDGRTVDAIAGRGYGGQYLGIFPTLNTVIVFNNGEWGNPEERVFDYNVLVEKWILPAIR